MGFINSYKKRRATVSSLPIYSSNDYDVYLLFLIVGSSGYYGHVVVLCYEIAEEAKRTSEITEKVQISRFFPS